MGKFLAPIRRAITYAIALLNVLAIVAVKPLIFVRLQPLNAGRIGHFLINTEITLARLELGGISRPEGAFDIWLIDDQVANKQVLKMRRQDLRVMKLLGGHTTRKILTSRPSLRKHIIDLETTGVDFYDSLAHTKPALTLSAEENREAISQARKLGLSDGAPWVCIANRDSTYLNVAKPGTDWSYHNYRNSSANNYVLAAETLADLGYYVFRMGRHVGKELPSRHKSVIDYANSDVQSDLLDVYLGFGCTFFLSMGSGVEDFAGVARRPRCYVNYVPFGAFKIQEPKSIHITKSHRDAVTNRVLTQSELIERGAHNFYYLNQYEESEIVIQENSPDEIRDVALEMHDLLTENYQQTAEDRARQDLFWSNYPLKGLRAPGVPVRTLIGRQFLRDNPQWLQ